MPQVLRPNPNLLRASRTYPLYPGIAQGLSRSPLPCYSITSTLLSTLWKHGMWGSKYHTDVKKPVHTGITQQCVCLTVQGSTCGSLRSVVALTLSPTILFAPRSAPVTLVYSLFLQCAKHVSNIPA